MKKIKWLAAGLAACMALTLCACGDETTTSSEDAPVSSQEESAKFDPYEAYAAAAEKSPLAALLTGEEMSPDLAESLTALDVSYDMNIEIDMDSLVLRMPVSMQMQMINDEANPQMFLAMDMDFLGQALATSVYYTDGTAYVDSNGTRIKQEMPIEEAFSSFSDSADSASSSQLEFAQFFGKDFLENATVTQEDGNTVVTYTLTSAEDAALLAQFTDVLQQLTGETGTAGTDFTFTELTCSYTLDADGMLVAENISMAFSMTQEVTEGESITSHCKADVSVAINALNEDVVITPPSGLDSYVDQTAALGEAV